MTGRSQYSDSLCPLALTETNKEGDKFAVTVLQPMRDIRGLQASHGKLLTDLV
jgi:hypothetical protein